MTDPTPPTDADRPATFRLVLLVTGDAPRSLRARSNLKQALKTMGDGAASHLDEIDLIREPATAIHYRVFATPALLWADDDAAVSVLYGDLSDDAALQRFLEEGRALRASPAQAERS
ncbi:MAG: hypothetical protein WD336_12320 [Trueperaceae bacterium]